MPSDPVQECSFLIPITRDSNLSEGGPHDNDEWYWLRNRIVDAFDGMTVAPDLYEGVYRDPNTKAQVANRSRRYIVAVPIDRLDDLRVILRGACLRFVQKCIYLSIAGVVEFIEPEIPWTKPASTPT